MTEVKTHLELMCAIRTMVRNYWLDENADKYILFQIVEDNSIYFYPKDENYITDMAIAIEHSLDVSAKQANTTAINVWNYCVENCDFSAIFQLYMHIEAENGYILITP